MSRARLALSIAVLLAACDPTSGRSVREDEVLLPDGAAGDAGSGNGDATASESCAPVGATRCEAQDTLLTCGPAATWVSTTCEAGCSASPTARCRTFTPTGAVAGSDVMAAGLLAITVGTSTTLDSATGAIAGLRAPGEGVVSGIGFRVAQRVRTGGGAYAVGVFSFESLTIAAGVTLSLQGTNSVALAAARRIEIEGIVDARGDCAGTAPGPGGFAGGGSNSPGLGPGAGQVASGVGTTDPGGGGGGHAALGGRGGPTAQGTYSAAGLAYGSAELVDLVGGSGGADGFNGGAAGGGGGGGALQLVAFREVLVGGAAPSIGGVNAGGCGGSPSAGSGGGGGAGGAILIEAPHIAVTASGVLAANGGGGGGAEISPSTPREHGKLAATPAPGAGSGAGAGGAGAAPVGVDGSKPGGAAGGGGGACGRIRLNALDPVELGGVTSPAPGMGTTLGDMSKP